MSRITTLAGRLALVCALVGAAALAGCKGQTGDADGGSGKTGTAQKETKKEAPKGDAPKDAPNAGGARKLELVYYDIPG